MRRVVCAIVTLGVLGLNSAYSADQDEPKAGGKTVSQWIEVLKSGATPTAQGQAAQMLGALGPKAKAAVPALIQALKKGNGQVVYYATSALGQIGAPAVPALKEAIKDKSPRLRASAAAALANVRPTPKGTVTLLIRLLKDDKSANVRGAAARALIPVREKAKTAVQPLLQALKDPSPSVRASAGTALKWIDPEAAKRAGVK
jgi:HEAT repeat protein